MTEIAYGSSNAPDLPPVDLPSIGGAKVVPPQPLKITVTKGDAADVWDSFPDAPNDNGNQNSTVKSQAQSSEGKSNATDVWGAFPDAPPEDKPKMPYGQDLGETLAKNAIPTAAVGRFAWPLDLANLAYHGGQYVGNKLRDTPLEGEDYNKMMSQNAVFGSGDIVRGAENAMGIEPHEPQYPSTQFANTVATTVLARNPVGMPALSIPQALSIGVGAGGSEQIFPDSQLAPLVGGILATAAHQPVASVVSKAKASLNNVGIGPKIMSISQGGTPLSATQGQANQAIQNINNAATNPKSLITSLNEGENISGSKPTMAEISPDQGIAQYQDATRTNNPAPFQQRFQDQNTARASQLQNIVGQGNPQNMGTYFVKALHDEDMAAANKEHAATTDVQQKATSLGRYGELPSEGATPDVVQNAQSVRKESERSAWKFLDKYKNSPADRSPVVNAAKELKYNVNDLGGEEHAASEIKLYNKIESEWPKGRVTVSTLKSMRTSIGDAMREVKPGTQAYRRLSRLRDSVDNAIENTVNGIANHESAIKTELHKAIDEWGSLKNLENHLINTVNNKVELSNKQGGLWKRRSTTEAANEAKSLANIKKQIKAVESRIKELEQMPDQPLFGENEKKQYESARKETFQNKMLTEMENSGTVGLDGTIDPSKYDRWYLKNRDKLKSSPEFRDSLKDWRDAQEKLNDMRAKREESQKAIQKSRLVKIINNDPVAEIKSIFSNQRTAQKEFADLVNKVKGDPDAMEGLKAAVGEHILNNVGKVELDDIGKEPIGKVGHQQALRDFVKTHKNSLREIYGSGQELQDLEAVAADIKRNQEWEARAKIKGQSNTAKDTIQAKGQHNQSLFWRMMEKAPFIGGAVGAVYGHTGAGVVVGEMAKVANSFRSKGLTTVKAIELEMLLHPSTFGNAMLQQIKTKEIPIPFLKKVSAMLIKSLPQESMLPTEPKYHERIP